MKQKKASVWVRYWTRCIIRAWWGRNATTANSCWWNRPTITTYWTKARRTRGATMSQALRKSVCSVSCDRSVAAILVAHRFRPCRVRSSARSFSGPLLISSSSGSFGTMSDRFLTLLTFRTFCSLIEFLSTRLFTSPSGFSTGLWTPNRCLLWTTRSMYFYFIYIFGFKIQMFISRNLAKS